MTGKHGPAKWVTALGLLALVAISGCMTGSTATYRVMTAQPVYVAQQPAPVYVQQPRYVEQQPRYVVQQPVVVRQPVYVHQPVYVSHPSPVMTPVRISLPYQVAQRHCTPGSMRVCEAYCGSGVQTCNPDGYSWGGCVEAGGYYPY